VKKEIDAQVQCRILVARREQIRAVLHPPGNGAQQRPVLLFDCVRYSERKIKTAAEFRLDSRGIAANPRPEHRGRKLGRSRILLS
jgi:hypothetical protein